jgi:hypothetical protein
MRGRTISTTLGVIALIATAAVVPAGAQPAAQSPAAPPVLSVEGLYPNVAEAGGRKLAFMLAYGLDGQGNMLKRLAIVDVTPGSTPRGVQHVFEPGRTKVTLGPNTYDLAMREFFNAERSQTDLEVMLARVEKVAGEDKLTAVVKTSLADLAEVRARQAREANLVVTLGDEKFWVTPGFFGGQSGFLFFDGATVKRLDEPARNPRAIEPRFVVMTTERRGAFDERLGESFPIGATGYVVAWEPARQAWVVKRAGA